MSIDWSKIVTAQDKAADAANQRLGAIRARRDQAINSGITVGGMPIQTDDINQARITGAALQAVVDPTVLIRWKTVAGFVDLDAPTIIAVATAVRAHVQACFDREAELLEEGESGGMEAGWP